MEEPKQLLESKLGMQAKSASTAKSMRGKANYRLRILKQIAISDTNSESKFREKENFQAKIINVTQYNEEISEDIPDRM
jgi:hypothetical protein